MTTICSSLCTFYQSTIGKKIIVAITGLAMMGWLLGHMLGNLQVFAGPGDGIEPSMINKYAAMLQSNALILWIVRIVMLKMIVLHVINTIQLTRRNRLARPIAYQMKKSVDATLASRTMIFGGLTLLFYLVYHIMHLTLGTMSPELFVHGDVYGNLVRSFQVPSIAIIYIVAQFALFMHLWHGIQSASRTLGVSNAKYIAAINTLGMALSFIITLGFVSIPVAIWLGCLS